MQPTLETLLRAIHDYVQAQVPGHHAIDVRIRLSGGKRIVHPVSPAPPGAAPPPGGAAAAEQLQPQQPPAWQPTPWATGPDPKVLEDFTKVYWPGAGTYVVRGEKQRRVLARLWDAYHGGQPEVPQRELLDVAESHGTRLVDLFRSAAGRDPAGREVALWGTLIITGEVPGTYRLANLFAEGPAEPPADATPQQPQEQQLPAAGPGAEGI